MASIFKRGEVWWIQQSVPGTSRRVRRSLKTKSRAIARRELQALEAELVSPYRKAQEPRNPSMEAFWEVYASWAADHLSKGTVELHERVWGYLSEPTGIARLGDITPATLEGFKRRRRKVGNSNTTINGFLRDLQAIFGKAIKWGDFTGANPVAGLERYPVSDPLVTFHSAEEREKLLAAAARKNPTIEQRNLVWAILLMGWAGLRKKEMSFSRWEWFDFDAKIIRVRESKSFRTKTRRERIIPMHDRIRDAMQPFKDDGFVFYSGRNGQDTSRYRFDPKKSLVTALKRAELPTDDPFQRLRRSFGSALYQNGLDLNRISEWMGNSPEVCRKHYAGIRQEYDADINRMK